MYVGISIIIPIRVMNVNVSGKKTTNKIIVVFFSSLIGRKQTQNPVNDAQGRYALAKLISTASLMVGFKSEPPKFSKYINSIVIPKKATIIMLTAIIYFFATYLLFIIISHIFSYSKRLQSL